MMRLRLVCPRVSTLLVGGRQQQHTGQHIGQQQHTGQHIGQQQHTGQQHTGQQQHTEPAEREPLIPEGARTKAFNRKPTEEAHKKRFSAFREEVYSLIARREPERVAARFQRYVVENPTSHYIPGGIIRGMSTPFAMKGDVERCKELLVLYRRLRKNKKSDPQQDLIESRILSNYLFSMMNCPDKEQGKEGARKFCEEHKNKQGRMSPFVLDTLCKVLFNLELYDELEELTNLAPSSTNHSPSAVLQLVQHELTVGNKDQAVDLFERHSEKVDLTRLNADHYALLAQTVTGMYEKPAYKQISQFLGESMSTVKEFSHFPVPLLKNATLCRNYEIVLQFASKRQPDRMFRIIGGRNGLTRQLEHISCKEYIVMVQYIVQLCRHYAITIDEQFWNSLFFQFFLVERRRVHYSEINELYYSISLYPLTPDMWCKVIECVHAPQLPAVFSDLITVGMMDDNIYTALLSRRTANNSLLEAELQSLSDHYTVVKKSGRRT